MTTKKGSKEEAKPSRLFALVRVKGRTHVRGSISDTMKMLNLSRVNHCSILLDDAKYKGMIFKVKDYVTWGEVSDKTLMRLLKERARVTGDEALTDAYVKSNSKFDGIKSFSEALMACKAKISDVKGLRKVFRLNPPKKGFERKGIKEPYSRHGVLGYRGENINNLIERMI